MELRILEERPNPLLKRIEYRFEVGHGTEATPSRDSVRTEFAKLVKVPKDRVIIERMNARYGTAKSEGVAASYQSTEIAKSIVREHILIRNGLKEKAVKSAQPAAETPAPAPVAKKEDAPPKGDHPKKEDSAPKGDHPKKEDSAPKGDHPKKEDSAPKGDHPKKEDSAPKGDHPKKEDSAPKGEHPKKDDSAAKGAHPKKEDAPKKDA